MCRNPSIAILAYDPSDFLLLKHFWTHIRLFLSLRAAFFSSSSNSNAVAANCLLENERGCVFYGNYRRPSIACCSGMGLNTTDSANTDNSDGTKMERWRNGNVTHSVNRPSALRRRKTAAERAILRLLPVCEWTSLFVLPALHGSSHCCSRGGLSSSS